MTCKEGNEYLKHCEAIRKYAQSHRQKLYEIHAKYRLKNKERIKASYILRKARDAVFPKDALLFQ